MSANAEHSHPHPAPAPLGGKLLTPVTITFLIPIIVMGVMLVFRFVRGIGAVTNLNDGYPWGLWIAWDVVIGSALAGGGFTVALLTYILNRGEYHPLVRPALVAALLGYMQAGFSVMIDLGRWWDFWHIFWPRYAQLNSVLFEVAICIMAYIVVMWMEFMPVVMERFGWKRARERLNKTLFFFVGVGVLLPTMHQSSLGTLLVVFGNQIHPLYQSKLLPLLFLTSTIGMGLSAVTLEAGVSSLGLKRPFEREILGKLLNVGRLLAGIYIVVRIADLIYRGAVGSAFQPSLPALTFWIEMFLFSVPLWLLASEASRKQPGKLLLGALSLAFAGILYRLSAFLVAYDTGAGWHYFPSLGEMAVTFGLISFEVVGIIFAIRLLPILPAAEPDTRTT